MPHSEKNGHLKPIGISQERKTDLRIVKTRNAIRSAFKEMVCEMDETEITVKDLAERAQIHRKTFYLHYSSIEALYGDVLQELANRYYDEISTIPADAPFEDVNRIFFTYMAKQEPFIEKMVCSPSYRAFANRFFISMLVHNRSRYNPYARFSQDEQNVINTFLCTTSMNIYRQWIVDEKRIPLDELIELSGKLFKNGISSVLDSVSPIQSTCTASNRSASGAFTEPY